MVPSVFKDPSAPEEERYKMVFQGSSALPEHTEHRRTVLKAFLRDHRDDLDPTALCSESDPDVPTIAFARYGALSFDGIQWKVLRDPLMIIRSDAQDVVYYDTNRESYIWFLKSQWYDCRRSIGRAETKDFWCWPLAETVLHPGPDLLP